MDRAPVLNGMITRLIDNEQRRWVAGSSPAYRTDLRPGMRPHEEREKDCQKCGQQVLYILHQLPSTSQFSAFSLSSIFFIILLGRI